MTRRLDFSREALFAGQRVACVRIADEGRHGLISGIPGSRSVSNRRRLSP